MDWTTKMYFFFTYEHYYSFIIYFFGVKIHFKEQSWNMKWLWVGGMIISPERLPPFLTRRFLADLCFFRLGGFAGSNGVDRRDPAEVLPAFGQSGHCVLRLTHLALSHLIDERMEWEKEWFSCLTAPGATFTKQSRYQVLQQCTLYMWYFYKHMYVYAKCIFFFFCVHALMCVLAWEISVPDCNHPPLLALRYSCV